MTFLRELDSRGQAQVGEAAVVVRNDDDDTESVLSDVSKAVHIGRTALLAEVGEQSTDVIDTAMRGLGGQVLRRSVDDVEAEIAASEKAQRAAKREARKRLIKATHEKHRDAIRAKIEDDGAHEGAPSPQGEWRGRPAVTEHSLAPPHSAWAAKTERPRPSSSPTPGSGTPG